MAKKKLDLKKLALFGGGALLVLWFLKKPASASAGAVRAKKSAPRNMLLGEPKLARYGTDPENGSCFDNSTGEPAFAMKCVQQRFAMVTDKDYWI